MTRSMSDEQMLAKYGYDKEPWQNVRNGERFATREAGAGLDLTFAPRPECIPAPDPKPWTTQPWGTGNRFARQSSVTSWHYSPRPWGYFTPDPEFARPDVNPILSAFRDDHQGFAVKLKNYIWMLERSYLYPVQGYTREQVDSALVVLERLARVIDNSTSTK